MAKFCTKCGTPLAEGQVCSCQQTANTNFNQGVSFNGGFTPNYNPNPTPTPTPTYSSNPNPNPVPNPNPSFGGNAGFNQGFGGGDNPNPNPNPNPVYGYPNPGAGSNMNAKAKSQAVSVDLSSVRGVWAAVKNHMGIGDPESNATDAFEKGKKIVPDIVKPNDKEIPVKQFEVAKLRNRLLGIPYMKAYGRIQVTNKRVLFRAPGKCIAGKTAISHEFAIDEIAGIETRREYVFNMWDLIYGALFFFVAGLLFTRFDTLILTESRSYLLTAFVTLFLAVAGCVPFALLKKKWWLKLMCLGGSTVSLFSISAVAEYFNYEWLGFILALFGWVTLALSLVSLFFHVVKPNLVMIIKTKSASRAIDISRKKVLSLLGGHQGPEHTGYEEVIPMTDAEKSIREIGAIINDIQMLGDLGVEKWKKD